MHDKIIRLAPLIKRVIFAAVLTVTALVFASMEGLFWGTKPSIKIRFNLEYDNYTGNQFRLHYKVHDIRDPWKALPPIKLDRRQIRVEFKIPAASLSQIWLEFGKAPGTVTCRDFRIRGIRKFTLGDLRVVHRGQVNNLELHPEGFSCRSSGNNPCLVFQPRRPLPGPRGLSDPWALGIVLVSVFIIALAVSRPIFNRGMEAKGAVFWCDGILVMLFGLALFIPMSRIDSNKISVSEKRKLAAYQPLLTQTGKIDYKYGKNFEAWFNDHFFGRDFLLKLNSWLSSVNFSIQPTPAVYRGFDKWHFYAGDNGLRNYHNLDLFTEAELARAADDLKAIRAICARKNKKLYLAIPPDKNKVYGEYFPGAARIRPNSQSRARQFQRYVEKNVPGLKVLLLEGALAANKHRGLLYWKNDTHWSYLGAYVGYLEVMKSIQKDFPDIPLCRIERMDQKRHLGDLELMAGGLITSDSLLYPVPFFSRKHKVSQRMVSRQRPVLWKSQNPSGRYNMLILRDSFSSTLLPYLANSFKNVTALWTDYKLPPDGVKSFPEADIIVFECVERFLPNLLAGIHATRAVLEKGVR